MWLWLPLSLCVIAELIVNGNSQGIIEVAGKVKGLLSKGRIAAGIAFKFVPCFQILAGIQDNMKKVGYNANGLRMCLEKAVPSEEEIQGKENVYVSKEELRSKIKVCIVSMVAAARGKNVDDEDILVDVKDCFMDAAQSLSALAPKDDEKTDEAEKKN